MAHMAEVENPPVLTVTPESDDTSGLEPVCVAACCAWTILAVSGVLVYLFCHSTHAPTVVRGLTIAGLVVGIVGIAFGALCCAISLDFCIRGNTMGKRQDDVPQVHP
jgi:hypothetical protein